MNFNFYEYIILIISGIFAGYINIFAGNGSIFTLSSQILLGIPINIANGTNRVGTVIQCLVGIYHMKKYNKFKNLLKQSLFYVIPTLIGGIIGAKIATEIDTNYFEKIVCFIMIILLIIILTKPKIWLRLESLERKKNILLNFFIFFIIGIHAGFIQIGMGILLISNLVIVNKYNLTESNIIKILITTFLLIPITLYYAINKQIFYFPALFLSFGQGIGSWLASKYAFVNSKKQNIWIRRILIIMILLTILQIFKFM